MDLSIDLITIHYNNRITSTTTFGHMLQLDSLPALYSSKAVRHDIPFVQCECALGKLTVVRVNTT